MIPPLGSTGNTVLYGQLCSVNDLAIVIIADIPEDMGDLSLTAARREMLFSDLFYIGATGK